MGSSHTKNTAASSNDDGVMAAEPEAANNGNVSSTPVPDNGVIAAEPEAANNGDGPSMPWPDNGVIAAEPEAANKGDGPSMPWSDNGVIAAKPEAANNGAVSSTLRDNDNDANDSERLSVSPPPICPICQDAMRNKFVYLCMHQFCFVCINRWSMERNPPTCPVCKRQFECIIHNIISMDLYDMHYVQNETNIRMFREGSGFAAQHSNATLGVLWRRYVYRYQLTARTPIIGSLDLRVNTVHFRRRTREVNRLLMWIERDFAALFDSSPLFKRKKALLHYTLVRENILSSALYRVIEPILGTLTKHFITELHKFAVSGLNISAFDEYAIYIQCDCLQPLEISESEDDSDVEIVEGEILNVGASTSTGLQSGATREVLDVGEIPSTSLQSASTIFPPQRSESGGGEDIGTGASISTGLRSGATENIDTGASTSTGLRSGATREVLDVGETSSTSLQSGSTRAQHRKSVRIGGENIDTSVSTSTGLPSGATRKVLDVGKSPSTSLLSGSTIFPPRRSESGGGENIDAGASISTGLRSGATENIDTSASTSTGLRSGVTREVLDVGEGPSTSLQSGSTRVQPRKSVRDGGENIDSGASTSTGLRSGATSEVQPRRCLRRRGEKETNADCSAKKPCSQRKSEK